MSAQLTSNNSQYVQFDVVDQTCGTTSYSYAATGDILTGTYSCLLPDAASVYIVSALDWQQGTLQQLIKDLTGIF